MLGTSLVSKFIQVLARTIGDQELNLIHELHKKATLETIQFIEQNNLGAMIKIDNRLRLVWLLKDELKNGMILEFGVFKGRSINNIAKVFPNREIYGFDTFMGLHENWVMCQKGEFNMYGKLPVVTKNIKLIKGLFENTLPDFLNEHKNDVAFIHIDSDLYSSAKTILSQLENKINNTYILFDEYWNLPDWKNHEYKAFMEFITKTGKKFEYVAHTGGPQVLVKVY